MATTIEKYIDDLRHLKCVNGAMYFGSVEDDSCDCKTSCQNKQTYEHALDELQTFFRTALTTAIEEARADAEHEAFESRQILWNRLKKWNNEWRAENPKERALTNEDALKLIEWKLEQVKEEARREALEEVRVRVSDSHVVQLPFCDDEFVHKTALLDYIDSLTK